MRILVVEDEESLNEVIVKHLKKQGYSVDSCMDGNDASYYLDMSEYDAVLLDVMLPGKDGWEVLRDMRTAGNDTPVMMLTARDSVEDKVKGLDEGADDYLTKPFSFDELMARIRMITRKRAGKHTNVYKFEDLTVDSGAKLVDRGGEKIDLSAKEYALLELLIMNKGMVLSRDTIEEHLWDYEYEGASNMVDVYIRYLRKKIDEGHSRKLIQTVRGQGYVMR
jgi:DNA-binding response OmpR family regulator